MKIMKIGFSAFLMAFLGLLLVSCGGSSGGSASGPWIGASLFSFPTGSSPAGFKDGMAMLLDSSTGADIMTASVTMSGATLSYNPANYQYEGNAAVSPGDTVNFSATIGGSTYTASGTQFTVYPTITTPVSGGTYSHNAPISVSWTAASPVNSGDEYVVGVLNPANPNGQLAWPADNSLHVAYSSLAATIPYYSLQPGDYIVMVCMAKILPMPGAYPGSYLGIAGCGNVPITVVY